MKPRKAGRGNQGKHGWRKGFSVKVTHVLHIKIIHRICTELFRLGLSCGKTVQAFKKLPIQAEFCTENKNPGTLRQKAVPGHKR
jgi:hypothetical protein